MFTRIDIDDRHYIKLRDFGGKIDLTLYFQTDNLDWVVHGGAVLTKEVAAGLGVALIQDAGKDREMLKAKFQRGDSR